MTFILKCPTCGTPNKLKGDTDRTPLCGKCKTPIIIQQGAQSINLTDFDFDNFIRNSHKPVLVDFWAQWCAPCRIMTPVLESFARSQRSIIIAKLDTERNPLTPSKFQIFSIPTLILFKNGKEVARQSGAMMGGQIEQWVKTQILSLA